MIVAALIISIVAAAAAGYAAWYTRSTATIERDRRHDEMEPRISVALRRTGPLITSAEAELVFSHDGGTPLKSVEVGIISEFGTSTRQALKGFDPNKRLPSELRGPSETSATFVIVDFQPGQSNAVPVLLDMETAAVSTRLLLTCTPQKGRAWQIIHEVSGYGDLSNLV